VIAMADITKPQVDAVLIGSADRRHHGMELTEAGLNVVALGGRKPGHLSETSAYPRIADELTYGIRGKLFRIWRARH